MRVRFTPSARRDFLEALAYIRAESPVAAEALVDRAGEGLAQVRDFPESGRVVPEFPDLMYREVIINPYRFFYRVADDAVWIVGVWHDRQSPHVPGA